MMTFGLPVAFCGPASVFFFVCQLTAAVAGVVSLTRNLEPMFLELQKPRLLPPVLFHATFSLSGDTVGAVSC